MDMHIKRGIKWGLHATLTMTVIMLIGMITKISPMPAPIPVALVKMAFGELPKPALMGIGMLAHLISGGVACFIFSSLVKSSVNL